MSKTYPKVYPLGHRGRPAGVEGGLQNKIDNSRQKSTKSRKIPLPAHRSLGARREASAKAYRSAYPLGRFLVGLLQEGTLSEGVSFGAVPLSVKARSPYPKVYPLGRWGLTAKSGDPTSRPDISHFEEHTASSFLLFSDQQIP